MIHTVKGFSVVKETGVDVFFWNSLALSMMQQMFAIRSRLSLPFLSPACTPGISPFKLNAEAELEGF